MILNIIFTILNNFWENNIWINKQKNYTNIDECNLGEVICGSRAWLGNILMLYLVHGFRKGKWKSNWNVYKIGKINEIFLSNFE